MRYADGYPSSTTWTANRELRRMHTLFVRVGPSCPDLARRKSGADSHPWYFQAYNLSFNILVAC